MLGKAISRWVGSWVAGLGRSGFWEAGGGKGGGGREDDGLLSQSG